jgi:hypothetical protein
MMVWWQHKADSLPGRKVFLRYPPPPWGEFLSSQEKMALNWEIEKKLPGCGGIIISCITLQKPEIYNEIFPR